MIFVLNKSFLFYRNESHIVLCFARGRGCVVVRCIVKTVSDSCVNIVLIVSLLDYVDVGSKS